MRGVLVLVVAVAVAAVLNWIVGVAFCFIQVFIFLVESVHKRPL